MAKIKGESTTLLIFVSLSRAPELGFPGIRLIKLECVPVLPTLMSSNVVAGTPTVSFFTSKLKLGMHRFGSCYSLLSSISDMSLMMPSLMLSPVLMLS